MYTFSGPPYKNGSNIWLTTQLFYERWVQLSEVDRAYTPVFSLWGREGYIDCRKTFLELGDPTGYLWAIKYLGSWVHFEKLLKCTWFQAEFQSWVSELKVMQKALSLENIRRIAGTPGPQQYLANKFVALDEAEKANHKRGKPTRAEVAGELKKAVEAAQDVSDDAKRIGLVPN